MIINLAGPIASGKTTFAKWFVERNPSWIHTDIAEIRRITWEKYHQQATTEAIEEAVWSMLRSSVIMSRLCILESTGTLHRMSELWRCIPKDRGIYTIKFVAKTKVCQERARNRQSVVLCGYDLDESYAIMLGERQQDELPANLLVETSDKQDDDNRRILFEAVEQYIHRAKMCLDTSGYSLLGKNTLEEK